MLDSQRTAALVIRAQRGEAAAFALLARTFLRAAYAVALAIVTRPADAEDVAQDAFVVALERIKTCREPDRFAGWLLHIVRNRALNWLVRRRLRDVPPHDDPIVIPIDALRPERIGLQQRLIRALERISPQRREIVLLHDLEEWTHAEIGAALGISDEMSRQHLFHARRELRQWLGEDVEEKVDHE